jgi:hypothetical protein
MRWQPVTSGEDARCAARGCPIPGGTAHWLARWKADDGSRVEAHYCQQCGAGSQAHPGDTRYGVWGTLALMLMFLVVLPLAWPQRWLLWLALFIVVYAAAAMITTRLFLRLYPERR